jgi:CRISPR-associated helicase Cas3
VKVFNAAIALEESERMEVFLAARSLLGRLTYQDHQSAAKQSGRTNSIVHWSVAYAKSDFKRRAQMIFQMRESVLNTLRSELKDRFHETVNPESASGFYFIDAPTGLGKTEAMLSAAEKMLENRKFDKIIFAVPQVSIADQIYEEYFSNKENCQIWNYLRREKKMSSECENPETAIDNNEVEFIMEIADHPFSESYNITTFNQVLLAMCHPLRTRCVSGIGLEKAVIILDEFHKLPMTILPLFFRIAENYAKLHDCVFIFGSATPMGDFEYLGLSDAKRIPREITDKIYSHSAVNDRRLYHSLGCLTLEEIIERVELFHKHNEFENLLVVFNLVAKGTWPARILLNIEYNPWKQLEELRNGDESRMIVFLDGLVPPVLRRELVLEAKRVMRKRPLTLITTQMIEVGVDLDFDAAFVDYQGIAATIQRGGRVGREGRGKPCDVNIFSLLVSSDSDPSGKIDTFSKLCEIQSKNDIRMKSGFVFSDIADKTKRFWKKEKRFFKKLSQEENRTDMDLNSELSRIQEKVFDDSDSEGVIRDFFKSAMGSRQIGYEFENAQFIAELFDSNYGEDIVVFKDNCERECVDSLLSKMNNGKAGSDEIKTFKRMVAERKITISNIDILSEMALMEVGSILLPNDCLRCFVAEASIF